MGINTCSQGRPSVQAAQKPQTHETYTNTSGSPVWKGRLDSQGFQWQRNKMYWCSGSRNQYFQTNYCFTEKFVTNCSVKRMYQGVRNVCATSPKDPRKCVLWQHASLLLWKREHCMFLSTKNSGDVSLFFFCISSNTEQP